MKKLISIGVALALLTMAIVPVAAAAQDYDPPPTYAKTPFAMIASGFQLLANLWPDLDTALGIGMPWVGGVFEELTAWTYGPLSWSVDMLGWGVDLVAGIVDALGPTLGLPEWIGGVVSDIACGLFTPWTEVVAPPLDPCP